MSNHVELLHGELLRVPPSFYSDAVVTSRTHRKGTEQLHRASLFLENEKYSAWRKFLIYLLRHTKGLNYYLNSSYLEIRVHTSNKMRYLLRLSQVNLGPLFRQAERQHETCTC